MRYAIVIEQSGENFAAYVPDLPGCVAAGESMDELETNIREAIVFHLESLRDDGENIPSPSSRAEYIDVSV